MECQVGCITLLHTLHILADAVEADYPGIPRIRKKINVLKIHCKELYQLGQTA